MTESDPTGVARRAGRDPTRGQTPLMRCTDRIVATAPGVGRAIATRRLPLAVSATAGLLLYASFPPMNRWWAAIPAFAGLAWVLVRPSTSSPGGLGYGFLFGVALYLPLLPWVGGLVGAMPWVALAILCAAFPAGFGFAAVLVRNLPGWPAWFAALWVAQEWLKSTVPFGGFPWGSVGFGQTAGPLLPLARVGGVACVSFAVVLLAASATALGLEIARALRRPTPGRDPVARSVAVIVSGVCVCAVLMIAAVVWPSVRRSGAGAGDEPTIVVAAVQGNVPRLGLDFNEQRREVLDYHVRETLRLADDIRNGRAEQPRLVVWPENSSDIDPLANPDAAQQIAAAARSVGAPILVGTVRNARGWTPENPVSTNSVLVWDPAEGPRDHHDKRIVQPFGEYLPLRDFFRHLSGYAERAGYFVPGSGPAVVDAAGVPVGVATCWEVIFDRAPRTSVRNGAQLLAVPTNNATFDRTMSEQQLTIAKLRAVEHDRYVVVAGTTGISAVIAPDGRELARTEFFEPAYLDTQVRLVSTLTIATRWGQQLEWLLTAVAVAALAYAVLHNRRYGPARAKIRSRGSTAPSRKEPQP